MYLRERLAHLPPGRFIEIGPGAGNISALLLSMGWGGVAYDLEPSTVAALEQRFAPEIRAGRYRAVNQDWVAAENGDACELVISCMVMEHLDDAAERAFIARARGILSERGVMITIVPGAPQAWGIEDDIAGHMRRYTAETLRTRFESSGWRIRHEAALTFPLSNLLLPLSNFLVRRAEAKKLSLSMLERTKQSGIRNVSMKTTFPSYLGLVLNERTMWPLHVLQKAFSRSPRALVRYVETSPQTGQ
jgi:SAM-dependent methyltransferase